MVATSYDTVGYFSAKYAESADVPSLLEEMGVETMFGVDGRRLHEEKRLKGQKFDRVVFNFPHTGDSGSTLSSITHNQLLLLSFLISSRSLLSPTGQIHVALRDSPFYSQWNIKGQAALAHLLPSGSDLSPSSLLYHLFILGHLLPPPSL